MLAQELSMPMRVLAGGLRAAPGGAAVSATSACTRGLLARPPVTSGASPWLLLSHQRARGARSLARTSGLASRPFPAAESLKTGTSASGFSASAAASLGFAVLGLGYLCGGSEPGGMATALSAAALLNGALLAHEAGHLAAARALGVAVGEFAVGVGPRVAWWQGATGTTYSLRAFPLFGYVTFPSAAQLGPEGLAALQAAAAAAGRGPLLLLEWLSPGRRAAVVAAGVAANALLAAALVGYQVVRYGELGVVVRPGARVRMADGYLEQQQQQQEQQAPAAAAAAEAAAEAVEVPEGQRGRLRRGDVVLRVGASALPAGGDMDAAFVRALEEAAAAATAARRASGAHCTPTTTSNGADAGVGAALEGVKLTVLRTMEEQEEAPEAAAGSAGAAAVAVAVAGASGRGQQQLLLQVDASEVLRYDTFVVGPHSAAGYTRPGTAGEAAHMLAREYGSWGSVVLRSWAEAAAAALSWVTGSSSSSSGCSSSSSSSHSADAGSCSSGASAQMVGPLGLVASAAAMAVAADRQSRAPSSYSPELQQQQQQQQEEGTSACLGSGSTSHVTHSEQPPALLDLGIQLNMQLAAVNLLPLPVLDGGQLLLVALEAARGGRRLPAGVERSALLASALLVGGWVAALSLADVVGLADQAAARLSAALAASGSRSTTGAAAGAQPAQLQLAVSVSGSSSTSGSIGGSGISRGFAADAAAAMDAWAV
ncbi:hypothetical protein HYH02_001452 [Chlamydomonas schloesseri]|uniref:Peptidase M50 domain-containing protein n=1 Tax=Chlamydomonas schloesseri TaxID=2026947 RepID=A0A836BCP2_9CHLO|nr:hypothetical protein HYH02_001452 [Chlamydomonas schloesseri]|eukprot:KAG2454433.1 hypothetical protein HYH02_001452 [Chlamydomonas schloesseri]